VPNDNPLFQGRNGSTIDASIPTPFAWDSYVGIRLAAKQGSKIFLFGGYGHLRNIEGRSGTEFDRFAGSSTLSSNVAGDWARGIQPCGPYKVPMEFYYNWNVWKQPLSYGYSPFQAEAPNFCEGAPTISFGWFIIQEALQQVIDFGPPQGIQDIRQHSWNKTTRVDRLCFNFTEDTSTTACLTGLCVGLCDYSAQLGDFSLSTSSNFTSAGTYTWTAPTGGLLFVDCQAGGGAGGAGQPGYANGGQGGGGGGKCTRAIMVDAAESITIVVGTNGLPGFSGGTIGGGGGLGGSDSLSTGGETSGGDGANVSVSGIMTLVAYGGKGGQGQGGSTKTGGGGYGSGGTDNFTGTTATVPTSSTGTNGGVSPDGAPGGTGGTTGNNGGSGVDGSIYGGGGGGSGQASSGASGIYGGVGGGPICRVTFIPLVWVPLNDSCTDQCVNPCATVDADFYLAHGYPISRESVLHLACS
jgi:hypothetical protein